MHRCRKPPIFAFAYIAPARSSKRRISSILPTIARQVSASGSAPTAARLPSAVEQAADHERKRNEERDDRGPLARAGGSAEHHHERRHRNRQARRYQGERVL